MAGEGEGVPRIMGRVVDSHRTGEADTVDEEYPEQDREHSWEPDSYGAGSGFGGSRERIDHRKPQSV